MIHEKEKNYESVWDNGFEGHAIAQMIRLSRLTFAQKLQWLEEMSRFLSHIKPCKVRHLPENHSTSEKSDPSP